MSSYLSQTENFSFQSLKSDFEKTTFSSLKSDLLAGLQVAFLTLPQAMAYSVVAGVPISAGIFASIFSSFIALLFSSSRYLIAGPVNSMSILIQTSIATILYTSFRDLHEHERVYLSVQILIQLSFLVAAIQTLIAVFRLGRLTQFVSNSVILGYICGTSIALIVGQLFTISGIPVEKGLSSLFEKALYLVQNYREIHIPTLFVGAFSFLSIILLKRINKNLPAALITITISTLVLYFFNDTIKSDLLENVATVGGAGEGAILPEFRIPFLSLRLMNQLLPAAFAIALLGLLETTCVSKAFSVKTGEKNSVNQMIFSIGLGNFVSSLFSSLPISLSPSRSILNYECGAQTRLSLFFNIIFVSLFISIAAFFINIIPLPTLSALLIITSLSLIRWDDILISIKATKADKIVLITTFISCLFFSLDIALYIGVFLAITSYLRKAAVPNVSEYSIHETGELKPISASYICQKKPIRLIKFEGELFFGAAEMFEDSLRAALEEDKFTKVIILQVKNARDIDATACLTLVQLNDTLKKAGCCLLIAGLTFPIWEVLSVSGVVEKIGKENLFLFDDKNPYHYIHKALERAKVLAQSSP